MNRASAEFLETAAAIGAGLARDAIWDGARCNWLGDVMELVLGSWQVVHRSYGVDLYGGTSGIALFLTRLYQATGEKLLRLTAEGAAAQCVSRIDSAPLQIGYYSGATGAAHALIQIGEALERSDFVDRGFAVLEAAVREEPSPYALDVIGGLAGAIPTLLAIHRKCPRPWLRETAAQFGERILQSANRTDAGWSWPTVAPVPGKVNRDLTGYSHGTGGVAWALTELHRATGRADFLEAALQGIRYEQSWYQPDQQNWPDFRNDSAQLVCAMAWCHGAPGIALGRLRMYGITGDAELRKQAEIAVRTTARSLAAPGQGESFCLCHGAGGNAEALILAAEAFDDPVWLEQARQVGMRGIEIYHRGGLPWPCGVMGGGENPSLLIGTAGIGYFYLRLADPERFPSVLLSGADL